MTMDSNKHSKQKLLKKHFQIKNTDTSLSYSNLNWCRERAGKWKLITYEIIAIVHKLNCIPEMLQ